MTSNICSNYFSRFYFNMKDHTRCVFEPSPTPQPRPNIAKRCDIKQIDNDATDTYNRGKPNNKRRLIYCLPGFRSLCHYFNGLLKQMKPNHLLRRSALNSAKHMHTPGVLWQEIARGALWLLHESIHSCLLPLNLELLDINRTRITEIKIPFYIPR